MSIVIISTHIKRMDNQAACKIIDSLDKKIVYLNLCRIHNSNIGNRDTGRRGIHLNNRGIKILPVISYQRYVMVDAKKYTSGRDAVLDGRTGYYHYLTVFKKGITIASPNIDRLSCHFDEL